MTIAWSCIERMFFQSYHFCRYIHLHGLNHGLLIVSYLHQDIFPLASFLNTTLPQFSVGHEDRPKADRLVDRTSQHVGRLGWLVPVESIEVIFSIEVGGWDVIPRLWHGARWGCVVDRIVDGFRNLVETRQLRLVVKCIPLFIIVFLLFGGNFWTNSMLFGYSTDEWELGCYHDEFMEVLEFILMAGTNVNSFCQIIGTSHDLTLKGSWGRECPLFQGSLGWPE